MLAIDYVIVQLQLAGMSEGLLGGGIVQSYSQCEKGAPRGASWHIRVQ